MVTALVCRKYFKRCGHAANCQCSERRSLNLNVPPTARGYLRNCSEKQKRNHSTRTAKDVCCAWLFCRFPGLLGELLLLLLLLLLRRRRRRRLSFFLPSFLPSFFLFSFFLPSFLPSFFRPSFLFFFFFLFFSEEGTREGHGQSDEHWNSFKGNVGAASERQGGAHIGSSERIDVILK